MTDLDANLATRLVGLVPDLVCLCADGAIVFVNESGATMMGAATPADLAGRLFTDILHPDHAAALAGGLEPLAAEGDGVPLMMRSLDGRTIAARVLARVFGPGRVAVVAQDLTGRLPALDSLLQAVARLEARTRDLTRMSREHALAARVLETASEAIMVLDSQFRVTTANPAVAEITGFAIKDVLGRKPLFFTEKEEAAETVALMIETVRSTGRWQGDLWCHNQAGEKFAARIGMVALAEDANEPAQFVAVFSDITQRKLDEDRIRRQANFDTLTGLPNRALFLDRLNQSVHTAERTGRMVGLMFIDLDGFKLVNDTLGHDMGDLLLQEAGRRLGLCVRTGDTVARLGGDEFTVLMPNLNDFQNAPIVAQRILDTLRKPFELAGKEAFVSASIGITVFPDDAKDAPTMLKNADAAMYRAKEQGKANFQFFTADMNAAVEERLVIKNGLSKALENDELLLYFQPKMELSSDTIPGVEALLRWKAADLGMVSPSKFIPVMEETGLIGRVGDWALEAACHQIRAWDDAGMRLSVAVNLSVRQLRQPGFAKTVAAIIERTGIPDGCLEFEITESMIMKDTESAIAVLKGLSASGIKLSMDDFGTGYSSLSYLKRFPVDTIKIDRSFISDLATDADSFEIIRTIISMGHSLKRRIVAEGVETAEQLDALRRLGCDEIQGYLLSPPVPAEQIQGLLATNPLRRH